MNKTTQPSELQEALFQAPEEWFDVHLMAGELECVHLTDEGIDAILDAVIASLPKGGQVPKDLLEHHNSKVYSAIYKNGWSDHDKVIFELLQQAKSTSKESE